MEKTQYTPIIIESLIFGKNSDYPLYSKVYAGYVITTGNLRDNRENVKNLLKLP